MSRPILSIGMIVKNEVRCLEKCLEALRPLRDAIACELVIADTGSDDGSWEIAARHADTLFLFPWNKDFSNARNAVMDRCTGLWYLSLDADEYLDPNIDELVFFLRSKAAKDATSAYLFINNYLCPTDLGQYSRFLAHRLLNMSTGARFEGAIHESWPEASRERCAALHHTILWHDGYINNRTTTAEAKSKRNMELLEAEIEADPDNLLRVVQAVQSARSTQQRATYTRKMIELVKKGVLHADRLAPVAYRDALQNATQLELPEQDQWFSEVFEQYSNSPYVQVDVNCIAITVAQQKKDYEGVLSCGQAYMQGIARLQEDSRERERLQNGPLNADSKLFVENITLAMASAHAHLQQWAECESLLRRCLPDELCAENVNNWLNVAYYAWEHMDLSDLFQHLGDVFCHEEPDDALMARRKEIFTTRCEALFSYTAVNYEDENGPKAAAFPLLAQLGDCPLAWAAKLMMTDQPDTLVALSRRIPQWSEIPFQAVLKFIVLQIPLPEEFYRQPIEKLQTMAGTLASALNTQLAVALEGWKTVDDFSGDLVKLTFLYDLTIAVLRVVDWDKADLYMEATIRMFLSLSNEYLTRFYHPSLLCPEGIRALYGIHRFAWYCLQAERAWQVEDISACVHFLRDSLETAPAMKGMVSFLMEQLERREIEKRKSEIAQATPELVTLAEQVRGILAAYPADDPAVQALKQSPAYQKVAFLIEEPASQFTM